MKEGTEWPNRPVMTVIMVSVMALPLYAQDKTGDGEAGEKPDPVSRMDSISDDTLRRYEGHSRESPGDRIQQLQTDIILRDFETQEHRTHHDPEKRETD